MPAPVIHVRHGWTIGVTFANHGTTQYSIDLHGAITPPSALRGTQPGKSIQFSFVATTGTVSR